MNKSISSNFGVNNNNNLDKNKMSSTMGGGWNFNNNKMNSSRQMQDGEKNKTQGNFFQTSNTIGKPPKGNANTDKQGDANSSINVSQKDELEDS